MKPLGVSLRPQWAGPWELRYLKVIKADRTYYREIDHDDILIEGDCIMGHADCIIEPVKRNLIGKVAKLNWRGKYIRPLYTEDVPEVWYKRLYKLFLTSEICNQK